MSDRRVDLSEHLTEDLVLWAGETAEKACESSLITTARSEREMAYRRVEARVGELLFEDFSRSHNDIKRVREVDKNHDDDYRILTTDNSVHTVDIKARNVDNYSEDEPHSDMFVRKRNEVDTDQLEAELYVLILYSVEEMEAWIEGWADETTVEVSSWYTSPSECEEWHGDQTPSKLIANRDLISLDTARAMLRAS